MIICLCGSTKFKKLFDYFAKELTLRGHIILQPNCFYHYEKDERILKNKDFLDKLHKRKIKLSDLVIIINKDKYIGESTSKEIEYAKELNKKILYMES